MIKHTDYYQYLTPKSRDSRHMRSRTNLHKRSIKIYHFNPWRLGTGREWGRTWLKATLTLLANSLKDKITTFYVIGFKLGYSVMLIGQSYYENQDLVY